MNYLLLLAFVCIVSGFCLVVYGDSKKKNATTKTDFIWRLGLYIMIGGFCLIFLGPSPSLKDVEAVCFFYLGGILFFELIAFLDWVLEPTKIE